MLKIKFLLILTIITIFYRSINKNIPCLVLIQVSIYSLQCPSQYEPGLFKSPRQFICPQQYYDKHPTISTAIAGGQTRPRRHRHPRLNPNKPLPPQQFICIFPQHIPLIYLIPCILLYPRRIFLRGYHSLEQRYAHAKRYKDTQVMRRRGGFGVRQAMGVAKDRTPQIYLLRFSIHRIYELPLLPRFITCIETTTPLSQSDCSIIATWQHQTVQQLLNSVLIPRYQLGRGAGCVLNVISYPNQCCLNVHLQLGTQLNYSVKCHYLSQTSYLPLLPVIIAHYYLLTVTVHHYETLTPQLLQLSTLKVKQRLCKGLNSRRFITKQQLLLSLYYLQCSIISDIQLSSLLRFRQWDLLLPMRYYWLKRKRRWLLRITLPNSN